MRIAWRLLTGILVAGLLIAGFALPAGAETELKQVPELTRVKAVAAAGEMYAALRADGKVFVWSVGAGGVEAVKPQQVEIGCPVRSVVPGANILAMACADGTVWTAGIAIDEPGVHRAIQVRGLDSVKSVALSRGALVALRTDGTVWVAEFGISEPGVQRAEQVPDLSGIIALAAGVGDFVAIKADGTAWSRMAINTKGTSVKRLANLPPVRSVAVCGPDDDCDGAADDYIFVTAAGEVIAWSVERDSQTATVPISGLDCAGCIAAGHRRLLAVAQDGSVRDALVAADGRIIVNDIKKGHTAFKQVGTGTLWDMGLGADGTVFMWAAPNRPAQVPGLSEVAAVAAAGQWNLALKADGQLVCWGSNDAQRTYVIPHVFETRRVVAAPNYFVTLNSDGSVAFGRCPAPGALPSEPVIHRDLAARWAAAGIGHVVIIKFDGTVGVADIAIDETGVHVSELRPVAGLDSAVEAAAGQDGYLVLRADGTVWGARWGQAPAPVRDVSGARTLAGGDTSFAVLLGDGSVRGIAIDEAGVHIWGDPHVDERDGLAAGGGGGGAVLLGADGTAVTFSRTVGAGQVTEILDGIATAAGASNYLVLRADGTVWSWRVR